MNRPGYPCAFSECRKYRYVLWRSWDDTLPYCQFIGLNPSTADETNDDPTIRRCIGFAKSFGYGALCMTNLFAWRDTDPKKMKKVIAPVGTDNDRWLTTIAASAGIVIAAWGTHGAHDGRDRVVRRLISDLHALQVTASGFPSHPLYLKADLLPVKF